MKTHIQIQIKAHIDAFANDLEALVRRAAVEAVGGVLGQSGAAKRGRPVGSGKKVASAASIVHVVSPTRKGGKRVRRSPEALGAAADNILKHIKVHPGHRSEEVRAALGIAKNVWVPAITKLLEDKKVLKKGEKRATTYMAK